MKKRILWTVVVVALGGVSSPGADLSASLGCVKTIEQVCTGLQDHLETCLAQRSNQLGPECKEFLQNAMSQAQDSSGAGICVEDMKRFCSGLDTNGSLQCITEKRAQFSAACQHYLDR